MRWRFMLDSLGHVLLRGGPIGDDTSTVFRRYDGDIRATTICFLPWHMPFRLAYSIGLVPRHYLACYEMPPAIVSSEPELCIQALRELAHDAAGVAERARIDAAQLLVVGLSIGNAVATYFANSLGARLCSIASADRGDLTLWESPASRQIKDLAESKGYQLRDFTRALKGYHAVENLENLAPGSRFIFGLRDEFVPKSRTDGLAAAVHSVLPAAEITYLDAGHIGTMIETVKRGFVEPPAAYLARA